MEHAVPKQIFALLLFMSLTSSCITRKPEYEFDSLKAKFGFCWGLEYTKRLCSHQPCPFPVLCHGYSCALFPYLADSGLVDMTYRLWLGPALSLDSHGHHRAVTRACLLSWVLPGCTLAAEDISPPASLSPLALAYILLHETAQPSCALACLCLLSFCLGLFIYNYYSVESCSAEAKRSIYGDWVLVIPNSAT